MGAEGSREPPHRRRPKPTPTNANESTPLNTSPSSSSRKARDAGAGEGSYLGLVQAALGLLKLPLARLDVALGFGQHRLHAPALLLGLALLLRRPRRLVLGAALGGERLFVRGQHLRGRVEERGRGEPASQ